MVHVARLMIGASCFALVAGYAHAQDVSEDAVDERVVLDSVTVTAQRVEESLQDVPISVAAVTGDALNKTGSFDTKSLQNNIAGLTFTQSANIGIPTIRGVGSSNISMGSEASVAIYVDGVYRPFRTGGIFALNNIEQVEVLRGPQGALFGRNSTGGVIQVITRTPQIDPMVDVNVGYASYDTFTGNFYGTTGLSENVAIDFAAHYTDQGEGWGTDLVRGVDALFHEETSLRSKLLWTPSDRTSITLAADYNYRMDDNPYRLQPGSVALDGSTSPAGFYDVRTSEPATAENEQWGASFTFDHDLGWANFKSISAYQNLTGVLNVDNDMTSLQILTAEVYPEGNAFSQEFQLSSPSTSKIEWIVGGFYLDADAGVLPLRVGGAALAAAGGFSETYGDQNTVSYAVFGQVAYPLTDQLRVVGGLRYTEDEQTLDSRLVTGLGEVPVESRSETFDKLSPRIVLEYEPTDDVLFYASYNEGFKSGAYNTGSTTAPAVKPETLKAYEVGAKTEFYGGRVRLNGATYYYDYKDLQVLIVEVSSILRNAATAEIYGMDADLEVAVNDKFTLRGGLALIESEFKDFTDAPIVASNAPLPGNTTTPGNASGNEVPRAPSYQIIIGGTYEFSDTLSFTTTLSATDSYFFEPDNRLEANERQMLSASLNWESDTSGLYAALWGKNLLDEEYNEAMAAIAFGDLGQPGEPLTIGVTLGARF